MGELSQMPAAIQVVVGVVVMVFAPAVASHVAVKTTLNGMRETVKRTETKLDSVLDELPRVRERVSVLESRGRDRE